MPDSPTSDKGYSQEDEYFKKQELEFLQKKRAELDAQRQAQAASNPAGEHWMKCPKCGGDMEEIKLEVVMVDKCKSCGGVYFDNGEVELLLKGKGGGLFGKLFG